MKWLRIEFLRKIDNPLFGHLVRARSEAVAHLQVFQKALSHLGHFFCSDRPGIGLAPTARLQPQSSEPDSPLTHATGSIQFVARRQGSSAVEQGTHKPLVGSSILPSGTCLASSFSAENSPAFQRWVLDHKKNPSPGRDGRSASCLLRSTGDRTLLSSLTGLEYSLYDRFPSVKTLGYCQQTQTLNTYLTAERPAR